MSIQDVPTELILKIFTVGCDLEFHTKQTGFSLAPYTTQRRRPKPFVADAILVCRLWRAILYGTNALWFTSASLTNCSSIDFDTQIAIYKDILESSRGCDIDLVLYSGFIGDTRAPRTAVLAGSLFVHAIRLAIPYLTQVRVVKALIRQKGLLNDVINLLTRHVPAPRALSVFLSYGQVRALSGSFTPKFSLTPYDPWLHDEPERAKFENPIPMTACLLNSASYLELSGIDLWGAVFLPRSLTSLRITITDPEMGQ